MTVPTATVSLACSIRGHREAGRLERARGVSFGLADDAGNRHVARSRRLALRHLDGDLGARAGGRTGSRQLRDHEARCHGIAVCLVDLRLEPGVRHRGLRVRFLLADHVWHRDRTHALAERHRDRNLAARLHLGAGLRLLRTDLALRDVGGVQLVDLGSETRVLDCRLGVRLALAVDVGHRHRLGLGALRDLEDDLRTAGNAGARAREPALITSPADTVALYDSVANGMRSRPFNVVSAKDWVEPVIVGTATSVPVPAFTAMSTLDPSLSSSPAAGVVYATKPMGTLSFLTSVVLPRR